jgi:hypothetical protein
MKAMQLALVTAITEASAGLPLKESRQQLRFQLQPLKQHQMKQANRTLMATHINMLLTLLETSLCFGMLAY